MGCTSHTSYDTLILFPGDFSQQSQLWWLVLDFSWRPMFFFWLTVKLTAKSQVLCLILPDWWFQLVFICQFCMTKYNSLLMVTSPIWLIIVPWLYHISSFCWWTMVNHHSCWMTLLGAPFCWSKSPGFGWIPRAFWANYHVSCCQRRG